MFFFFNDTATTEIYTLSLHDALPILRRKWARELDYRLMKELWCYQGNRISVRFEYESHDESGQWSRRDRKSTRLNSSHANISYAVFCLKKKKKYIQALYYKK